MTDTEETDENRKELTHRTAAEYSLETTEWPKFFVSGEGVDVPEDFPPAYYRVRGPNGPVSFLNPGLDEPVPTTMHSFAMEAQSYHFREVKRDETPFASIDETK